MASQRIDHMRAALPSIPVERHFGGAMVDGRRSLMGMLREQKELAASERAMRELSRFAAAPARAGIEAAAKERYTLMSRTITLRMGREQTIYFFMAGRQQVRR